MYLQRLKGRKGNKSIFSNSNNIVWIWFSERTSWKISKVCVQLSSSGQFEPTELAEDEGIGDEENVSMIGAE